MKHILLYAIVLLTASCSVHATNGVVKGLTATAIKKEHSIDFAVDSIMYRDDVTRIYGKFKGHPHTSWRIDEATLSGTGIVDIDGVDLKRWFQWEDDGIIPVELDFPPHLKGEMLLQISGPKGEGNWLIKKRK